MKALGWDERDLAYHSKLALPTVQDILAGRSGGRVSSLEKIIDALGVTDVNDVFDVLN